MKRKARWWLILIILAAFAVWLEPTRVPWGWLRGEAFYDGRPTSWWARELERWEAQSTGSNVWSTLWDTELPSADINAMYFRSPSAWDKLLEKYTNLKPDLRGISVVTNGDPMAEPVLRALAELPSRKLRFMARSGLLWMKMKTAAS